MKFPFLRTLSLEKYSNTISVADNTPIGPPILPNGGLQLPEAKNKPPEEGRITASARSGGSSASDPTLGLRVGEPGKQPSKAARLGTTHQGS